MVQYKVKQEKNGWYRVYQRFWFFFWLKTFGRYRYLEDAEDYMARCMEGDRIQAGRRSNP